ncbi:GIY-YIG nuclease family protein [Aeromonas jandaei]|uniref:GIY-YIG nuclease family protein n=1 Tax=Aeromonas jandaei TaxID=650 RepID=UPI003BA03BBE
MLNIKNYNELLHCTVADTIKSLVSHTSQEAISFNNINKFPNTNGIYLVSLSETIIYIGKADKQKIKTRCNQYLNASTGGTLRKKLEIVMACDSQTAINYIINNLSAKFIEITDINTIPTIEEIAIWAYQPKLNVVKPTTFSYENCKL